MLARVDHDGLDLGGAEALRLGARDAQHRVLVDARLAVVLAALEDLDVELALTVVGGQLGVRLEVLDERVAVQHAGVAHVLGLGERPHVVAALEEEARGDDGVGALGVDRLAVDADLHDALVALTGGVEDVLDVLGDAEGQERLVAVLDRAAVGSALPLLLEHLCELRAADLAGVQGVAEGDHAVGLGVGDHAVALAGGGLLVPELGADAAGVHEADDLVLAVQAGVLEVPLHGVGEHVTGGGVAAAVVALGGGLVTDGLVRGAHAVHVGGLGVVPRGGDVAGQGADGLGADHGGVIDRRVRDLGDVRDDVAVDGAVLALGQRGGHERGIAHDVPVAVGAELEGDHAEVRGAGTGLDDRADLALHAGDRGVVVVGAVRVAVEDRIDRGGGPGDDLVEDRVGVGGGDARLGVRARTLVVGGDEHVVLLAGGVELLDRGVDPVHRVAELEALDRDGADLADGLGGDRADDGHPHALALDDGVRLVDALTGRGVVDVRGEVGELGARLDAVEQVVDALVVLVVADRGGVDPHRVEHVEGGLVVLHGGLEGGAAHIVTGGEQEAGGVVGAHGLDRAHQARGAAERAVEVVEGHQRDLVAGLGGGRSAEGHDGGGESHRCGPQADGGAPREAPRGGEGHGGLLGTRRAADVRALKVRYASAISPHATRDTPRASPAGRQLSSDVHPTL